MSRLSLTVFASALLLAGCDSGAGGEVQQPDELNGDTRGMVGQIDRSFSGREIPSLVFADPDGKTLDLGDLDGQPLLVNLWATWCAPCVIEMPMLDGMAGQMGDDLRVVTVSQDMRGADVVTPFFAAREFEHLEPWLDPENTLSAVYSASGELPLTVLFDAQGREVFRVVGGYRWDSEEAIAAITEALEE